MITSLVNGITKHQFGGENFIYYFATCIVNVSGDEIQYLYFNNETPFRFSFSSLDEKYSTTTAEGFVDYLANNNYFVIPVASTGSGLNVTIVGNDTDFSTGAKQDEQTTILSSIDSELDTQTIKNQSLISCLNQLIEVNHNILYYIKSIAE